MHTVIGSEKDSLLDPSDREWFLRDQYRDASNLNARISLHARFSTNMYGWFRWVYDQLELPRECRILELGCGPAGLWVENRDRICEGWEITLSDLSPGMVREARVKLSCSNRRFSFTVADAVDIPFSDRAFDAVVANHMLYHVSDLATALAEIHRVLRPGGRVFASTVGRTHLRELRQLVKRFGGSPGLLPGATPISFDLENGREKLLRWFSQCSVCRYQDTLLVAEAEPLVAYVLSTAAAADLCHRHAELVGFVERELALRGPIRITKDTGLFVGVRRDREP